MKKQLPELAYIASADKLLQMEILLVMAEYERPSEAHNNDQFENRNPKLLRVYNDGGLRYFSYLEAFYKEVTIFREGQEQEILKLISEF